MVWTAYGILPEHVGTLTSLFTINTKIIHGFTFWIYLLNAYEVWYVLKRTITLFKILCPLRFKENEHKLVCELARFQWSHAAKMA
jgi:hypothetical protein